MPTQPANRRVAADETVTDLPQDPTPSSEPLSAEIPGADPSKFITITLSHPLNERDRNYLGLPQVGETEVGQKVRVSKNGAKALVSSGYATVDPEDSEAVAKALQTDGDAQASTSTSTGGPQVEPGQNEAEKPAATPASDKGTTGTTTTGTSAN